MYHDFSSLKGKEKMFYMCFFSVSLCKYLHKQQLVHKILGCRGWWRRVCTLFLGELCGVSCVSNPELTAGPWALLPCDRGIDLCWCCPCSEEESLSKKKPRLFCDICGCFDLHDTEDCPTQAQALEEPPHSAHHGSRREERPYCDTCEVFGHWTADCNDDETF